MKNEKYIAFPESRYVNSNPDMYICIYIFMYGYMHICVCIHFTPVVISLLFPCKGCRMWALSDQADFRDWMSFLRSNLMEEISCDTEALSADT